jgi:hypothetical protein
MLLDQLRMVAEEARDRGSSCSATCPFYWPSGLILDWRGTRVDLFMIMRDSVFSGCWRSLGSFWWLAVGRGKASAIDQRADTMDHWPFDYRRSRGPRAPTITRKLVLFFYVMSVPPVLPTRYEHRAFSGPHSRSCRCLS